MKYLEGTMFEPDVPGFGHVFLKGMKAEREKTMRRFRIPPAVRIEACLFLTII